MIISITGTSKNGKPENQCKLLRKIVIYSEMESNQQNWKSCQVRTVNNYVKYAFSCLFFKKKKNAFSYNSDNSINRT